MTAVIGYRSVRFKNAKSHYPVRPNSINCSRSTHTCILRRAMALSITDDPARLEPGEEDAPDPLGLPALPKRALWWPSMR
jgi:hypothetical protein